MLSVSPTIFYFLFIKCAVLYAEEKILAMTKESWHERNAFISYKLKYVPELSFIFSFSFFLSFITILFHWLDLFIKASKSLLKTVLWDRYSPSFVSVYFFHLLKSILLFSFINFILLNWSQKWFWQAYSDLSSEVFTLFLVWLYLQNVKEHFLFHCLNHSWKQWFELGPSQTFKWISYYMFAQPVWTSNMY